MVTLPFGHMQATWDLPMEENIPQHETGKTELTLLSGVNNSVVIMNKNLQLLMTTCISIGTAETLSLMGVHSGEISMRKARDVYGKWFTDAVNDGRIFPSRVENGRAGTKWFKVTDILALKADDLARAELIY